MSFKEVKLKYIATLNPSKSELNLATFKNKAVSFLPMDKIISPNNLDLSLEKTVEEVYSGYTYFRENDIVLAKVTPCFENGNIAVAKELKNGIGFGTTELHVLRVDEQLYDKEYIYYCLQLENFKAEAVANMYGVGGLKRIPTEFLSEYKFPVPDLKTQVAIRKYLNLKLTEISSLIENKNKLIKLLEQQRQSIITEAVTKGLNPNVKMKDSGVEWIGEIPEHWDLVQLTHVSKITRLAGYEYTEYWEPNEEGEVVALRGQNIGVNKINILGNEERITEALSQRLGRSRLYSGDVVFPCVGSIGKAACIYEDDKYHINQNIAKLTPSYNLDSEYLTYYLNSELTKYQIRWYNTSEMQPSVLVGNLRKFKITLPPIDEQKKVIDALKERLVEMNGLIGNVQKQINFLKEYRQALIYEAVTGKIDVRDMELD